MVKKHKAIIIVCVIIAVVSAAYIAQKLKPLSNKADKPILYDYYVKDLDVKWRPESYIMIMQFLEDYYGVHCLIAGIEEGSYEEMRIIAPKLFEQWEVGSATGKGILLLLNKKEKIIKIEVGHSLEHIFTDAYCGYLENNVFSPWVKKDNIMRALWGTLGAIQHKLEEAVIANSITPLKQDNFITKQKFPSGGAGVTRDITKREYSEGIFLSDEGKNDFTAQATPEGTFELYKEVIRRKIRNPDLGIYSEKTILANKKWMDTYVCNTEKVLEYPYLVKAQNATRAIIVLKSETGTNRYGPFFLVKTSEGWKMDLPAIRFECNNNFLNEFHFRTQGPYYNTFYGLEFDDEEVKNEENVEELIKTLQKDISTINNIKSYRKLGKLYYSATYFDKAIEYYKSGLKIKPKDYVCLWEIARTYQEINEYKEAIKYYEVYRNYYPQNKDWANRKIGQVYLNHEEYDKSIKTYKKLLKSKDKTFREHGYAGLVYNYCMLNKIKKAKYYHDKLKAMRKGKPYCEEKLLEVFFSAAKKRNK